jgi:hypothetical protein
VRLSRRDWTRVGLIVRSPRLRYISSRSGSKTRLATTLTPKMCLAICAAITFRLSPRVALTNTSAFSMPTLRSTSRSMPLPTTLVR